MIVQDHILRKALDAALSTGADFAEVFLENTYSSTLSLLSSQPQQAVVGELYGAGIRLFFNEEIIYVTTNDLSEEGLVGSALKAARSHRGQPAKSVSDFVQTQFDQMHTYGEKPWESDRGSKFAWLKSMNQHARSRSSYVVQVEASLHEKFQKIQIANSIGVNKYDERIYSRTALEVTAERNGVKESFSDRQGFLTSADFVNKMDLQKFSFDIADRAVQLTTAQFAPAGEMPVVIDTGFGGVIFHEACGHLLETTQIERQTTPFMDKKGEKIAHESLTAWDEGLSTNAFGSIEMDDEGMPAQRTLLIEKGILKNFIADRAGSVRTGHPRTGSGRRQGFNYAAASRMRNTFIAPGEFKLEQLFDSIDKGIYCKKMGGGSVGATGEFNFAVDEAYLIEKGKLTKPLKGATLIGEAKEIMNKISMCSEDIALAAGFCGSVSGSIYVTVGQPHIKVDEITVGGR